MRKRMPVPLSKQESHDLSQELTKLDADNFALFETMMERAQLNRSDWTVTQFPANALSTRPMPMAWVADFKSAELRNKAYRALGAVLDSDPKSFPGLSIHWSDDSNSGHHMFTLRFTGEFENLIMPREALNTMFTALAEKLKKRGYVSNDDRTTKAVENILRKFGTDLAASQPHITRSAGINTKTHELTLHFGFDEQSAGLRNDMYRQLRAVADSNAEKFKGVSVRSTEKKIMDPQKDYAGQLGLKINPEQFDAAHQLRVTIKADSKEHINITLEAIERALRNRGVGRKHSTSRSL